MNITLVACSASVIIVLMWLLSHQIWGISSIIFYIVRLIGVKQKLLAWSLVKGQEHKILFHALKAKDETSRSPLWTYVVCIQANYKLTYNSSQIKIPGFCFQKLHGMNNAFLLTLDMHFSIKKCVFKKNHDFTFCTLRQPGKRKIIWAFHFMWVTFHGKYRADFASKKKKWH